MIIIKKNSSVRSLTFGSDVTENLLHIRHRYIRISPCLTDTPSVLVIFHSLVINMLHLSRRD